MNRALLVGINTYPKRIGELNGCVNDITDMAKFLVDKCGFEHKDIRLLTDDRATTKAIRDRLGWLLSGLRAGDRVVFHYSGHGAQIATRNEQGEVDRLDEIICPVDFDWSEQYLIRDKDFNRLFSTIPDGVEFIWISDSCCSKDLSKKVLSQKHITEEKTISPPADISWRIQTARKNGIKSNSIKDVAKQLNLALISGCDSDKSSEDASFGTQFNGVLTHFLIDELKSDGGLKRDLNQVLEAIRKKIKDEGFTQTPHVEGSTSIIARPFLVAG